MYSKRSFYAVIVPTLGWSALASADVQDPKVRAQDSAVVREATASKELPFCHKASDVIGSKIKNAKKEDLGKVEELVIDPDSGEIQYAVLSFGGFLGMGDKLFAIPFSTLRAPEVSDDSRLAYFTLDVDKAKLEKAPGFPKDNWPDIRTTTWCKEIDNYYGTMPVRAIDEKKNDPTPAIDQNEEFRLCKASDLMGSDVHNTTDDELGEIKELVLDPHAGRVNYFVLTSGGFLGLGNKLFAIPWEALDFQTEEKKDKLVLSLTKERLERAPEFKEDEWNLMTEPVWVNGLYDYYGCHPYWSKKVGEAGAPHPGGGGK